MLKRFVCMLAMEFGSNFIFLLYLIVISVRVLVNFDNLHATGGFAMNHIFG